MFKKDAENKNRLDQQSQAEQISLHINNLINTFGMETVKETLTLFNFQYKVEAKTKKGKK